MEDYTLLIDLYKNTPRQGPGSNEETEKAINLAKIDRTEPLQIADIGCGTGASTLVLARLLNAQITAVDFLQDFLDVLKDSAQKAGLSDKIKPLCCSMDDLPFQNEQLDVIWSEGAIYNIGFEAGVKAWKRYLKPGGLLVVSEITWLTHQRPETTQAYWESAYPEIDVCSSKISVLEKQGYSPLGYFALPEDCWLDHYYRPLQAGFEDFLTRNSNSADAQAIVDAERQEIALYEAHKTHYSYGVYIAKKLAP
ncbi:MAG: class I SAM-dependent methyltransferase [Gammaproteobacteria bacterium]|nr:class I SAM-dependent methyltransferase [Gammaproteobacteria bacterium]